MTDDGEEWYDWKRRAEAAEARCEALTTELGNKRSEEWAEITDRALAAESKAAALGELILDIADALGLPTGGDRAEHVLAAVKWLAQDHEKWQKHYLDVADAVARESINTEDLCRQARETRRERDAMRTAWKDFDIWARGQGFYRDLMAVPEVAALKRAGEKPAGEA